MRIRKILNPNDVLLLLPVIYTWRDSCSGIEMDIDMDEATYVGGLQKLVEGEESDLYILEDDKGVYGYMGMTTFNSPLGRQKIANEHHWYVIPEKRGVSALRFIPLAQKWAREKECSHLIMSASNLASELHDNVCEIYKRFGMKKFETSYIKRV